MEYGLRDWSRREPARVALEFEKGDSLTYAELERMANRFANFFATVGLVRGDHVAGILSNGPHIVAAVWGACRSGLYFTPVAHTFSAPEIAYVVDNSEAKVVIADARFADKIEMLPHQCPKVDRWLAGGSVAGYQDLDEILHAQPGTPRDNESPGMLMMYSSGTTGVPKGIWRPLPTREQVANGPPPFARDLIEIFGFEPHTRFLSPAPLYHAAPLRWSLAVLASGGTAVIMSKFDAARALDILETRDITLSQWVPTMFRRMLNLPEERRRSFSAPLHKAAWHAAAPCSPDLKRRMIDWWGSIIHEYYAGSESVGLTKITAEEWLAHPGSVGRAYKGKIHILSDDWSELPPGQTGRVYFGGTSLFEYFGDPEKTTGRRSPQNWQTLGEIGRVDEEGWLFLSDRLDDMIISGGVNIYPQEIEQAIEEMPEISECAVAAMPDEDFGERPAAFLVPARDALGGDALVEVVRAFCDKRLGRTKQPCRFIVVDDLPKSEAGKVLRRELRNRLAEEEARTSETRTARA